MAINITSGTVARVQELVFDAFSTNATLDRCKSILATTLACPTISNMVHKLAHKYALDIGDGCGDLIEPYNEPVNYGGIAKHIENYTSVKDVMDKVLDVTLVYQNELNLAYKEILANGDIHVLEGLSKIIDKHNSYVEMAILWKDMVDKYEDNPCLDVDMEHFDKL